MEKEEVMKMNTWALLAISCLYLILAIVLRENKEALVVFSTSALVLYGIFLSKLF
jgi:hypothetical protein